MKPVSFFNRALIAVFILVCLAVSCATFRASYSKWFTLDEALLSTRAHMINKAGLQGPIEALGDEGFTHPPLYEASLALVFKIFGENEIAGRSFGIFCYLLVGLLMFFLFLYLVRDEDPLLKKTGLLLCFVLYGLNPLLIQHSMLLDAETTCTYVFSASFVCLFVAGESWTGRKYILSRLGLGALFAITFFGKEVTPFFLIAGTILYRLVNRQWKRLAAEAVFTVFFGVALIALGFIAYRFFSGQELVTFLTKQYGFRAGRAMNIVFVQRVLRSIFQISRWPVFWMSAPFFIFLLYCLFSRFLLFFRSRRLEMVDYCFFVGVIIWTPYLFFKPSVDMMKYQYPAYPFFIVGMVYCFLRVLRSNQEISQFFFKKIYVFLAGIVLIGLLGAYYYRLGDYICFMFQSPQNPYWKAFFSAYYAPILVFFAGLVFLGFYKRKVLVPAFLFGCLIFIFSINAALDLRQIVPYTTAESWLNYGEEGFKETIQYLSERMSDDVVACVRDDMFYYLNYRYGIERKRLYSLKDFFSMRDPEALDRLMTTGHLKFLVVDSVSLSYIGVKNIAGIKFLKNYRPEKTFGNFKIFKRKGIPA